ncbi:DUF1599 domain-containing protein [Candidatus Gracilibacteria bacterium]|nr:DUF1599 domain-containing protein [Candidatus Gracilibacteria bacterium]
MATKTYEQWWEIINTRCLSIFIEKIKDYGSPWLIMRLPSMTDQIFIKANRIRTIQELKEQKIDDGVDSEYIGIINYCIMALIKISNPDLKTDVSKNDIVQLYHQEAKKVSDLLEAKNHDYGEAWRQMREMSFTDLILMKLLRIKQIENNNGKTSVSEGVEAGYQDIINYSVFALIKRSEN